jgi:hypothetical protein
MLISFLELSKPMLSMISVWLTMSPPGARAELELGHHADAHVAFCVLSNKNSLSPNLESCACYQNP